MYNVCIQTIYVNPSSPQELLFQAYHIFLLINLPMKYDE